MSKFIAVMMDDTIDSSNIEQSAVSVHLVHDGVVEEHLLGLIDASGDESADRLTAILLETLESYNVKPARTEIQGGPGGPWPPQKFSVVAAVSLYSFISISDYQIGTPFSYVISFNLCLSFV